MLAGMSESVAVLVITMGVPLPVVRFGCAGRTGADFTSLTVTMKLFVALSEGLPLSVTIVVKVFVEGPCGSLGVQEIMPEELIVAPAGGETRAYVSTFGGR